MLIACGRHLVRMQLALFALSGIVSGLILWKQPAASAHTTLWTVRTDPVALLGIIWTVQVTMAAVVYPIVIAFVALLYQQRRSSKIRMLVFLQDSGAMASGLSSLMLCFVATVQWFFCWMFSDEIVTGWMLFDTAWLAVNIAGSIFFLNGTFEFLRSEKEEIIVKRYAIDVIWRREVTHLLSSQILALASYLGLVPKSPAEDGIAAARGEPAIIFSQMMSQSGTGAITLNFGHPRELTNVWFLPLRWAVKGWLARAEKLEKPKNGRRRRAALYFPAIPNNKYEDGLDLCRVEGPVLPTRWERFLIKLSFRFSRYRQRAEEPTVSDLFGELASDVLEEASRRQPLRFRDSLYALSDLHAEILKAGEFKVDSGEKDNYALLSQQRMMAIPIQDSWARHYFPIFEQAASATSENPEYIRHIAYLPIRLFGAVRDLRNIAILDRIISLGRIEMDKLGGWWVKAIEERSADEHDACTPAALDPFNRANYEIALNGFVGAWEELGKHYFDYGTRSIRAPWSDLQLTTHFQTQHLAESLLMYFNATARGDQQMAEHIADSFRQWVPCLQKDSHVDRHLARNPSLLTMGVMDGTEAALLEEVEFAQFSAAERDATTSLICNALDNLWTDYALIAAYCLADWGRNCVGDHSLPALFINLFLSGRSSSTRVGGMSTQPFDIDVVFWGMIRQQFSDPNYRAQLNSVAERIQGIRAPAMVSGRIYSSWGTNDLDALVDAQLVTLCLRVRRGWQPEKIHDRDVLKILRMGPDRPASIARWLEKMIARLAETEFGVWSVLYGFVANTLGQELSFSDALSALSTSLESFKGKVDATHLAEMQQADIDPAQIDYIANWASKLAFRPETGALPLLLFQAVEDVEEPLPERNINFTKLDRGEFTLPQRSTRPINEGEVVADRVRDLVGVFVLQDVMAKTVSLVEIREATDPDLFWAEFQAAVAAMKDKGLTPILLLQNPTEPAWVWEWGLGDAGAFSGRAARPKDLRIERRQSFISQWYVAHFNDVEVYHASALPVGSSHIFAKETFHKLEFRKLGPDRYVTVEPNDTVGEPLLINLRVKWGQRITVADHPVIRLHYGASRGVAFPRPPGDNPEDAAQDRPDEQN